MKKEYGIIKIQKSDSDNVKEIKKYNNKIVDSIKDTGMLSHLSGIFGGFSAGLFFTTLAAFKNNSKLDVKIITAVMTALTYVGMLAISKIARNQRYSAEHKVSKLSKELIRREKNK